MMKLAKFKLLLLQWRLQIVVGILLVLCSALMGYRVGNWTLYQQQQLRVEQLKVLQQALQQAETTLAEQRKKNDFLTAELAVEKSTVALQQQDLKAEQQKLFEIRKELAFYQKIISPNLQANSLIIDSFNVSTTATPDRFRFNLVLIEQDKQKKFAKGQITLQVLGLQQGKPSTLDVLELAGFSSTDRKFSFRHFQIFDGEFSLPADFTATKIEVTVQVPATRGSKAAKFTKTLLWQDLTAGEILE